MASKLMKFAYKWKDDVRVMGSAKIDAQKVGEYIDDVGKRHGGVLPNIVVEEARPEGSLLHACFEWDDSIAAQKQREFTAANIIRSIVVVRREVDEDEEKIPTVRAFVSVKPMAVAGSADDKKLECRPRQYVPIQEAITNDIYKQQMLDQAYRDLSAFRKKYDNLEIFCDFMKKVDEILPKIVLKKKAQ